MPQILSNIQSIEQQIKTSKTDYQKTLSEFAESERDNLQVLDVFCINIFGQEGAETFIEKLNKERKIKAIPLIELGTKFTQEMKNSIAHEFSNRIL